VQTAPVDHRRFSPVSYLLAVALLLYACKFSMMLGNTAIALMPMSLGEWVFATWPAFLAPALGGLCLVAVLAERRSVPPASWWRHAVNLYLPLPLLLLAALVGATQTTEVDFALLFGWHLLGAIAFVLAALLHLESRPEARSLLQLALVAGAVFVAWSAWYEQLFGLAEMREYLQQQEEQGERVLRKAYGQLDIGRVRGEFTNPNMLGAYLVLVIPFLGAWLWRVGGGIDPPGPSRGIFLGAGAIAWIGSLWLTHSRAPLLALFLAALITLGVGAWAVPTWRRYRGRLLAVIGALVLLLVASLIAVQQLREDGLSLATVETRLQYWGASVQMIATEPLSGVGLGEWFPQYLRLKAAGDEETRYPHNSWLFFQTQAGLLGGVAALYLLLQPFLLWYQTVHGKLEPESWLLWPGAFCGLLAWLGHSLADFTLSTPALLVLAGTVPALVLRVHDPAAEVRQGPRGLLIALGLLAVLALAALWRVPGEAAYARFYSTLRTGPQLRHLRAQAKTAAAWLPAQPYVCDLYARALIAAPAPVGPEGRPRPPIARLEDAILWYERAVARAPHRPAFHARLADALAYRAEAALRRRNAAEALALLDRALAAIEHSRAWYPAHSGYREQQARLRQMRQQLAAAVDPADAPDAPDAP